jgi:hypothetical protein
MAAFYHNGDGGSFWFAAGSALFVRSGTVHLPRIFWGFLESEPAKGLPFSPPHPYAAWFYPLGKH